MDICPLPEGLTCLLGEQPVFGKLSPEGLYMEIHKWESECKLCLCSEALCNYLGATRPVLFQLLPVGVFQEGAVCLEFSACPGLTKLRLRLGKGISEFSFMCLMVLEMPLDHALEMAWDSQFLIRFFTLLNHPV